MKTQKIELNTLLGLGLLFLILLLPGIVFGQSTQAKQQDAQKFPNFLKITMNPDGSPKTLQAEHQKWMEAQSLKQYEQLQSVQGANSSVEAKRSALLGQLDQGGQHCEMLKKFESSLTSTDIKECQEFYSSLAGELRTQIMSYGAQELDDAIELSLFALEKMKNGQTLKPEEQIDRYVQTQSFKNQLAELPEEMQKEVQLMMKLSKDPEYRKAIETGDEAAIEKILKAHGVDMKDTPAMKK